jgi:hypothetical protein
MEAALILKVEIDLQSLNHKSHCNIIHLEIHIQ